MDSPREVKFPAFGSVVTIDQMVVLKDKNPLISK